jgi:hypothetical protein
VRMSPVARRAMQVGAGAALVSALVWAGAMESAAQQPPGTDGLALVSPLVGRWSGTTDGQPGKGTVERAYERALGDTFIRVQNRSTYPPQPKNTKGEVHQDAGFFSYDRARKAIVFRQFHGEGFVNQYVVDPSSTSARIVMTTEAIENIPPGWRARETYVIEADTLEEMFELAPPGKAFEVYSKTRLTRAR